MKTTKLLSPLLLLALLTACVKQRDVAADPTAIVPPAGFLWEMSSNVAVTISINDTRFGDALHTISLYDTDPAEGGKLLSRGAASTNKPFATTLLLADTLHSMVVVKTAPDLSAMQQDLAVTGPTLSATLGKLPVPAGKPLEGPDCSTGCVTTITTSNNNIIVKQDEVVCITGNDITVGFTANNKGTIRICGTNVIVENANLNNGAKLIVASTGSVQFKNLTINNGIGFENYGTTSVANFSPNGPVINTGTLNITGDFNITNTGSLSNSGIITATGNMTVNGKDVFNKGKISVQNFIINGSAKFTNTCNLAIAGDYSNNGQMFNYQLITVEGATTVNGGSNLEMYNAALLITRDMTLNSTIEGFGTTSLVKVSGNTTINNPAGAKGAIQYCDANGIEVDNSGKKAFTKGAVTDCSVYIPTSDCNTIGNGKPGFADSDGDGIADELDAYPSSANKAFDNYYPADKAAATIAFEDLWPWQGDYDFNDLVMGYHYNLVTNATNNVVTVNATFSLFATGGSLSNAFGIEFPLPKENASNVTGATIEDGQDKVVLVLFTDMRKQLASSNTDEKQAESPAKTYQVSFDVKNGALLKEFGLGTFNPFIWNFLSGTPTERNEIHLPGYPPTSLGKSKLFGTADDATDANSKNYYLTKKGMPWAINLPATFKYPKEGATMQQAYLNFTAWANSGGVNFPNWYSDIPGNRKNEFIYKP